MKYLNLAFVLVCFLGSGCVKESSLEKTEVKVNSAKRSLEKTSNRMSEEVCGTLTGDSKTQCLGKKMKNRLEESQEAIRDKASEIGNKMDKDNY